MEVDFIKEVKQAVAGVWIPKPRRKKKVLISSTDWAIVIDTDEISLFEWLKNLKEQYPLK